MPANPVNGIFMGHSSGPDRLKCQDIRLAGRTQDLPVLSRQSVPERGTGNGFLECAPRTPLAEWVNTSLFQKVTEVPLTVFQSPSGFIPHGGPSGL